MRMLLLESAVDASAALRQPCVMLNDKGVVTCTCMFDERHK